MTTALRMPEAELSSRLRTAASQTFGPSFSNVDTMVRRSDRADYQANLAMGLGKQLKQAPRVVAEALIAALDVTDICDKVEIAGPGFINFTLRTDYLSRLLQHVSADARLGVPVVTPEVVIIDYGSPNVAKEMHVGHLRTSVIGDALARTLEFAGHTIIRQNHIGDWGTPFGMLIEHLVDEGGESGAGALSVGELNAFYRAARAKFDADPSFAERARNRVVLLQGGDVTTLALWRTLVNASIHHFSKVFQRLGVQLNEADIRGESFYNARLPEIADDLSKRGLAVESEGALCVFVEAFKTREGETLPLIVRKNDGGYGYAATDLAAIRFRSSELHGTRMIYVVGSPQQQHLAMVFDVAQRAGYLPSGTRAEHVGFGSILGADRKMFKTRSGETVRLIDLLNEGEERALAAVSERNADLDLETRKTLARQISLGAIKYADLSNDRIKDYILDWSRMLAFEGNTGPYLQYAHARIRAIFRKLEPNEALTIAALNIEHPSEKALALALVGFEDAVRAVTQSLDPHKLCSYLYELASAFTTFYEACPVLRAETTASRASRLALADLTAKTLERGLDLLGIEVPSRM